MNHNNPPTRGRAWALDQELSICAASCLDCKAEVWALETRIPVWPVKLNRQMVEGTELFTIHRCPSGSRYQ